MSNFQKHWDEIFKSFRGDVKYDNWLDKFEKYFPKDKSQILDLGSGLGNNVRYLTDKGYKVIATDYSKVALESRLCLLIYKINYLFQIIFFL